MIYEPKRNKQTRGQGRSGDLPRLLGERLCLDFANAVEGPISQHPEEFLRSYADLVQWGWHAGALAEAEAGHLAAEAERRPADAAEVFGRALELREAIYRTFRAVARGEAPPQAELDRVREEYLAALGGARLVAGEGGYSWAWDDDPGALDRVLWPVARSAVELLTSAELGRVKECPGAGDCGWLFLDTSKNGTRRWCSMEGCGSRLKMRRQYAKRRAAQLGRSTDETHPD
jgi:predicted RNA-binding Zn ribbon-like protein